MSWNLRAVWMGATARHRAWRAFPAPQPIPLPQFTVAWQGACVAWRSVAFIQTAP